MRLFNWKDQQTKQAELYERCKDEFDYLNKKILSARHQIEVYSQTRFELGSNADGMIVTDVKYKFHRIKTEVVDKYFKLLENLEKLEKKLAEAENGLAVFQFDCNTNTHKIKLD